MRILSVELEGFGPFRERQRVDFTAFEADGIFLIGGRTGAGKTSILDAICFALYGSAPRYEGVSPRLRSDHCAPEDPTEVVLEFETGEQTYRLRRSPEYQRPKLRGDGLAKEAARATLEIRRPDGWEGLAARPVDVVPHIARIVQLSREQFLQVILLAQNRFHEFLLADSEDRQKLLRTLFGTRRFDDYDRILQDRRRELESELTAARGTLDGVVEQVERVVEAPRPESDESLAGWAGEGAAGLETTATEAERLLAERRETETAAEAALDGVTRVADRQRRAADARARLLVLEARHAELAPRRAEVEAAARAAQLAPFRRRAATATEALDAAESRLDRARAEHPDAADASAAELSSSIDELTGALGSLEPVLALETGFDALLRREFDSREALAAHDATATALAAELGSNADRRSAIEQEETAARLDAAPLAALRQQLETVDRALAAARAAVELEAEVEVATAATLDAARARAAATVSAADTRARLLRGQAAHLAERLDDGAACPVCGSVEHPSPAVWEGEPVSDDDVAEAEVVVETASAAVAAADSALRGLQARAAELRGASEGRAVDELDEERTGLTERRLAAEAAERRLAEFADERARLTTRDEVARSAQASAGAAREALVAARAADSAEVDRCRAAIAEARGEHDSISERVASLTAERRRATTLREARSDRDAARTEAEDAAAVAAEQRAALGFDDDGAVAAALLEPAELARRRTELESTDTALAATRGVLAEADLQDVPADAVDLDAAREARRLAGEATRNSVAQATSARTSASEARRLATRLATELTALGGLVERTETLRRLAASVHGQAPNSYGMRLESYVLAAELEDIVVAANARLGAMSAGRYLLEHTDRRQRKAGQGGLDLAVIDQHTGVPRPPRSLSGGETFLASLALALGLAEVVTARAGGIRLDTLFIDEGFGSLDADTLEIAMTTLDGLRQGGRTIGLISHVEAMKEQIPSRIAVGITPQGWSEITTTVI